MLRRGGGHMFYHHHSVVVGELRGAVTRACCGDHYNSSDREEKWFLGGDRKIRVPSYILCVCAPPTRLSDCELDGAPCR